MLAHLVTLLGVLSFVALESRGQLFPFHTLATKNNTVTANTEPPIPGFTFQDEPTQSARSNERPSRHIGDLEPDPFTDKLTSQSKYIPQTFIAEPVLDPNHQSVPSIIDEEKEAKFIRHSGPPVRLSVVESKPSASVLKPPEYKRSKAKGPPPKEYLMPPKYPSVYDTTASDYSTSASVKEYRKRKPSESKDTRQKQTKYAPSKSKEPQHIKSIMKQLDKIPREPPQAATQHKKDFRLTSDNISSQTSLEDYGPPERVEFQMHGQAGPASYKFGYDTGKGRDRQFRFEEKDDQGNIKGQYGYYDKQGNLKVVNYQADEKGFRVQPL